MVRGAHSCVTKPLKHTPLFRETISCLTMMMGESNDLGRNPRSHAEAKPVIISAKHERFLGEKFRGGPRFQNRADNGDFPQLISKWGVRKIFPRILNYDFLL